ATAQGPRRPPASSARTAARRLRGRPTSPKPRTSKLTSKRRSTRTAGSTAFLKKPASRGSSGPPPRMARASFMPGLAWNVKGGFFGLRHVLPEMIRQGSGTVVNTASVAGLTATPGMPAYVASKHAVLGLTKAAAGEVARQGVRVNAVCPGPVDTRMIHALEEQISPGDPAAVGARYQAAIPSGRYTTVDEIANMVLFLCSDLASNTTGGQFVVDGGRTATGGSVTNLVRQ